MDPLSDIVSRLKISSQKIVTFDMSANTKALFPGYSGMKIYIAKRGSFFIKLAGDANSYPIEQGDVLILSSGREFSIFDNPNAPAIDITKIHVMKDRSSCFSNGGCDFSFVGCRFVFQINDTFRFITSLPEPIVIKTQREENAGIKDFLSRLSSEIETPGPGSELITEHLLQIILTQALRMLLSSGALGRGEGWFYAMADKHIGLALTRIHDQPGRKWRLDELAGVAGMSRTAFTTRLSLRPPGASSHPPAAPTRCRRRQRFAEPAHQDDLSCAPPPPPSPLARPDVMRSPHPARCWRR